MATPIKTRRRFPVRLWVIGVVAAVLIVLALSLRSLAFFYTDALWFRGTGFPSVWRGLVAARYVPAMLFTVGFFFLLWGNLTIAARLAPPRRNLSSEDELLNRYDTITAPYAGRIRVVASILFALIAGANVSSHWDDWILFRNAQTFGQRDPQFHKDIGFYVFRLPFIQFVLEWLFAAFIIVFILTVIAHYLNGGIRLQPPHQRVTPQVKAHLSVLLGVTALVRAAQYYYERFGLNFSTRGVVDGAMYTDIKAQLPALNLLIFIAITAAVLFLVNIWRRGWVLPIVAVGLWAFVSIIVGAVYPAIVQRFQVKPNELAREQAYIQRNVTATRDAFGVNDQNVERRPFAYQDYLRRNPETGQRPDATAAQTIMLENQATLNNARLWDPDQLRPSFQNQQGFRSFDMFSFPDVDRYDIGGTRSPVLVAARELNSNRLPSSTWTSRHLIYTHGYGAVAALGNEVTADNAPRYEMSGIPPRGPIEDAARPRPEVYYGEGIGGYVVVNTKQTEFQPSGTNEVQKTATTYTGGGGVQLSNVMRRAAVSLRFSDLNPLISGQITSNSRVLFDRDVSVRIQKVAPFLALDANPYLVVVDGRQLWVVDAYTTSDRYPYSQAFASSDLSPLSGLQRSVNYVRNSVKATVDAYDGSVRLYVVDEQDPVLKAYRKAFPKLFTSVSDAPAALTAHFRYPEDLFRLQSTVLSQYHVTDPALFYGGEPFWAVSADPGAGEVDVQQLQNAAGATTPTTAPSGGRASRLQTEGARQAPQYQLMRLPGADKAQEFVLMRAFVPINRETQLSAFMVARSDALPTGQRKLIVYELPKDSGAPTPVIVDRQIKADKEISPIFTLLDQRGSQVIQGNLQLLPVGNTIVWVRPIYVRGQGADSYPQYTYVAVTYGERSVLHRSVGAAIQQLFFGGPSLSQAEAQGATTPTTPTNPTTPTQPSAGVQALLEQANQKFADAQAALKAGDLGKYQALIDEAGRLIDQARQSLGTTTTTR